MAKVKFVVCADVNAATLTRTMVINKIISGSIILCI
jgi:hypothetical protein